MLAVKRLSGVPTEVNLGGGEGACNKPRALKPREDRCHQKSKQEYWWPIKNICPHFFSISKILTAAVSSVCDLNASYVVHSFEIHSPPGGWCGHVILSMCAHRVMSTKVTIDSSVNTTSAKFETDSFLFCWSLRFTWSYIKLSNMNNQK